MPTESANRDPRQFSLRELFKLTLIVAIVLAAGVLARDSQHFHWLWSFWTLASLLPIVAVWLVQRLRLIQPRTLAQWSIAIYGLSMFVPAVEFGVPFPGADYFGVECFLWTFLFIVEGIGIPGAAANTAFIVGCLFLFNGLKRKDTTRLTKAWWWSTFGTLMAVASLLVFPELEAKVLYPGYWLWLASMIALALGARGARLDAECLDHHLERVINQWTSAQLDTVEQPKADREYRNGDLTRTTDAADGDAESGRAV